MALGRNTLRIAAVTSLLACLQPPGVSDAVAAQPCLDVALVLTVDASASVSREEFAFQQQGIAAAFRDREVLNAVKMAGQVAVAVIFWGSEGLPKPQSRWMRLDSEAAAEAFAQAVEQMPRQVTGDTGLGAGLLAALQKFDSLEACAIRKVVNVSGDGEETRAYRRMRRSPAPSIVRDLAGIHNVEINALAVSNEEEDLASYYAANVITGPDAFVMDISSYDAIAYALRRKLIREIGPRAVSEHHTAEDARGLLN
jgi:hypothetical protein